MKKEYRFLFVFLAVFIIALLAIVTGDTYTMRVPAVIPLGAIAIGIWMFLEAITEIGRGQTEHIIFNNGHKSIREKDLHKIPWQEPTDPKDKKKGKISIGDMVMAFTGGIDFWGFSLPGTKNDPVLIFPSLYLVREENNYHSYANIYKYKWEQLPRYIQDVLGLYLGRVDTKKTPIYYGTTSHLDGSATPENLTIERKYQKDNEYITSLENINKKLREEIWKEKTRERPEFILGKAIRPEDG